MSNFSKDININQYLIGSNPEAMRADIMYFKNEVLVDFKELNKKLEEKYSKINQEIANNMELFNQKISQINIKLLELSTKIITDANSNEKINELLNFKDKAESLINSNKNKISIFNEETNNRINQINLLLRESIFFPGLIGPRCKFKNLNEYIEFILNQVNSLNDFKEKNLIDLKLYKTKIEHLLNVTQMKMDNVQRETNNFSLNAIKKSEDKLLREISYRDEKIKEIKLENQNYFLELNNNMKNYNGDIKESKEELNNKLVSLEQNNENKINKIIEKHINFEKKIFDLQNYLSKIINILKKEGVNIPKFNHKENLSHKNSDSEIKLELFQRPLTFETTQDNLKIDKSANKSNSFIKNKKDYIDKIEMNLSDSNDKFDVKTNDNNKKENEIKIEKNIEENKKKVNISNKGESDIKKYVKGEITADEIGLSRKNHHKFIFTRNQYEEFLISKSDYQKNLSNKLNENSQKDNYLIKNERKSNKKDKLINNDYFLKNANSFENINILKTEKRMIKSLSAYKNIMNLGLKDLDAKFHSKEISKNLENKSGRNKIKKYSLKFNIKNKSLNNYQEDFRNNNNKDQKVQYQKVEEVKDKYILKNLNIISNSLSIQYKNNTNQLATKNISKIKSKMHQILSPFGRKVNILKNNYEKDANLIKLNNDIYPKKKMLLAKIAKSTYNNENNNDNSYNKNEEIISKLIENTK